MCVFPKPEKPEEPQMPTERAAMRQPDTAVVSNTARRAKDQARSATATILTSGSGVSSAAPTQKKTLLGA